MAKKGYNYSKRASQLRYEIKKIYRNAGFTEEYAKEKSRELVSGLSKRQLKSKTPTKIVPKQEVQQAREFRKARRADQKAREERYKQQQQLQKEARTQYSKKERQELAEKYYQQWYGEGEFAFERLREMVSRFPKFAEQMVGSWLDQKLFELSAEFDGDISKAKNIIGNAISEAGKSGVTFTREIAYSEEALQSLCSTIASFLDVPITPEELADASDEFDSYSEEYF